MRAPRPLSLLLVAPLLAQAAPEPPSTSTLLLQGFDLVWERRPHRVRTLGMGFDARGADGADPSGTAWAEVQGGTWASGAKATDVPVLSTLYAGVSLVGRQATRGTTHLVVHGTSPAEPRRRSPGSATAHVVVPTGTTADAAVWLTGFRVETAKDHPDGFTVHALGVEAGAPTVVDGAVVFDLTALVEAAPVPDRGQDLADYGAVVDVDWVVVPSAAGGVRRVEAAATLENALVLAAEAQREPAVAAPVAWVGVPTSHVVSGLSGFRVVLEEEGALDGRYLRALAARVADERFDPLRHTWSGEVALRFANLGQVTRPLRADVTAQVTVLALGDGERAWSGRWDPVVAHPERVEAPYPGL